MWGPTQFSPLMKVVNKYIELNDKLSMYHILLLLTDGQIHDIRETIDMIVDYSAKPLSIIIVGVGENDFKGMQFLDGDVINLRDG